MQDVYSSSNGQTKTAQKNWYNPRSPEQNTAEQMLNALKTNNAPFLPKEDGRLSPYAIINANTGKILEPKDLFAMQLKQASNPDVFKTPVAATYSSATKAGANILKQEEKGGVHFNYKTGKTNADGKPEYGHSKWYFPEQTSDPAKVTAYAETKANELAKKYPAFEDPRLPETVFTINSPEEYLSKYLAACRTGAQVITTAEVAEAFKSQIKEICNNSLRKQPDPEISTLHKTLLNARAESTKIIDNEKAIANQKTIAAENTKTYQPAAKKREASGYEIF